MSCGMGKLYRSNANAFIAGARQARGKNNNNPTPRVKLPLRSRDGTYSGDAPPAGALPNTKRPHGICHTNFYK